MKSHSVETLLLNPLLTCLLTYLLTYLLYNVKSVLLYGSETWRLTKKIFTQLQTFTNRRPRYILGVWWPKKISNEELWKRTQQERIEVTIRRMKWRWIGHQHHPPVP